MILRIGHTEILVRDLEAARRFYVGALGFIVDHEAGDTLYLRGGEDFDTWTLALCQAAEPGLGHFALRVATPADLEALEQLHERLGVDVRRVPAGAEPGQGEALRVRTPDGAPVEFYVEMEQLTLRDEEGIRLPMRRAHQMGGLPPKRIDHVNLRVPDMGVSLGYWCDELGFSMSEGVERDGELFAAWLRRSEGTHDVAVLKGAEPALHHFAFALAESADVIRAADLLADAGFASSIEFGPGRHGVTNALFLYVRDPDGNRLELFVGDYARDHDRPPVVWAWDDFLLRGRLWWGHEAPPAFQETTGVEAIWPHERPAALAAAREEL
ncbi:MAG: hpaD [Conexibacter sp.]|nr:hpaD [Conexibacter sp.]